MKLLVQPGDGVKALVAGIERAKSSIEIVIFRFDRHEIELALSKAAARGVFVHALIAYTNRGGERNLRKLEMRLLAAGVTVARTAADLARYHSKFMIVDHREVFILSFNFTHLDIDHSRCFGLIVKNSRIVQEASKLFEADTKRQHYTPGLSSFVVSPANSRKVLAAFLKGAKKDLLIYDPGVADAGMIKILTERANAGVSIRIIGKLSKKGAALKVPVRKLGNLRLHTRTIIRDGSQAFIGSQSLRELELDGRREVGLIFRDSAIVAKLTQTFGCDWDAPAAAVAEEPVHDTGASATRVAKKVAKAVAKDMAPVAPVLSVLVDEAGGDLDGVDLTSVQIEETVRDAVKEAVKEAVREMVEGVAHPSEPTPK